MSYSIYVVSKKINRGNKRIQEQLSVITTKAQETFAGIRIIKSFGAEENFELILAALKSLMENHYEPHDYELNEAAITVDGFDTKEDALSFTRREFGYNAFKRAFDVPDSVAVEKISAQYKEGILTVSLPKKEEALPQPKKLISVK